MASSVQWRDLALGSAPGDRIVSIEGWEGGLPPTRYDKTNRARAHGSHPSPVWSDERTVTVTGTSSAPGQRDALLIAMQNSMALAEDEEPLAITLAGRTLTASAQLLRFAPAVAHGTWNFDLLGWVAMWRCTDPLRYGPTQTASTGLPTSGGGLTYPLAYPLTYGAPGNPGQMTLSNAGNADAPIVFTVSGGASTGLAGGFELSAAGQRITYPTGIAAGETVTIDTAQGTVLSQGTGDRRGQLTNADWLTVPTARDGGTLTVQFVSLGGSDAAANVTAQWGDTWW